MIALLAAATLAAIPQPTPTRATLFVFAPGGRPEVLAGTPDVCNKDPRMQRAAAARAILRNSDRRYVAKRLIDLPVAYMCHAGGPKEGGK